ncbi:MAG: hypothetical protein AAB225_27080 [Acidobacteriota bacterium]
MGGVQGVGNLDGCVQEFVRAKGLVGNSLPEGLAFEELHDDERLALELVDAVDGADVGVVQRRGGAGLALEALQHEGVLGKPWWQEFQGYLPPQPAVLRPLNDTHAAAAERIQDAVVRHRSADHARLSISLLPRPAPRNAVFRRSSARTRSHPGISSHCGVLRSGCFSTGTAR